VALALTTLLLALSALLPAPLPAAPAVVIPSFSFAPMNPVSLQPVEFTSTSTATGNTVIVSQAWDLDGDGTFETPGPTAARSFPLPGKYTVRLQVTDLRGRLFRVAHEVHVGNRPPIASMAQAPQAPATGDHVTFFSTSTDPDGSIAKQTWDLNADGKFDDGNTTIASRTFDAPGTYTVGLKVVDNRNAVSIATAIVVVADRTPPVFVLQAPPRPARLLMTPFPIVRISGVFAQRGIRLRLLTVQAPRGARVDLLCNGHGCPFRRRHRTVAIGASLTRTLRFRQFRRHTLRVGTTLRVLVSDRTAIGKYTRFRVRRSVPPLRLDRCLPPAARSPIVCPSG
jgi:PKD repeat protein